MTLPKNRNYNCKDEELTVVSGFVFSNLKRDLADFSAFSPKFTADYLTSFETKKNAATELVEPESEMLAKKMITERYSSTIAGLSSSVNKVSGYLKLAFTTLKMNDADFGLSALRKTISNNDVEGFLAKLSIVLTNIATYKAILISLGLTDEFISTLSAASDSVAADRQEQYEIISRRKGIVQNNIAVLNDLYNQMNETLNIGKALYKGSDPARESDYTFTQLLKKVRQATKTSAKTESNEQAIINK